MSSPDTQRYGTNNPPRQALSLILEPAAGEDKETARLSLGTGHPQTIPHILTWVCHTQDNHGSTITNFRLDFSLINLSGV